MVERLKLIRNKLNLERDEFAVLLTYEPKSYQNIENGNEKLGRGLQKKLQKYAKVNLKWFATGEGNMFIEAEKQLPDKPPSPTISPQYTNNRTLTTEEMMSEMVLTNKMLAIQHGELIKMLAKHTDSLALCADTINKNSLTINNLSANNNISKNVEGQAS